MACERHLLLLLLLLSKVGVVSLITLVVDTKYFFCVFFCYVTFTLFASHTRPSSLWLALFWFWEAKKAKTNAIQKVRISTRMHHVAALTDSAGYTDLGLLWLNFKPKDSYLHDAHFQKEHRNSGSWTGTGQERRNSLAPILEKRARNKTRCFTHLQTATLFRSRRKKEGKCFPRKSTYARGLLCYYTNGRWPNEEKIYLYKY